MLFLFLFGILGICYLVIAPTSVGAQCPVCIVTVGGGMLLAKKLGVDDLLISIWISALNTAVSFWIASKMKNDKRLMKTLSNPWLLSTIMLLLTLFYFKFTDQVGHPDNQLFGVDKIVLGQVLGMLAMFVGNFVYGFTKYQNHRRAIFPYAKVVFPLSTVLITTLIFKFVLKL